MHLPEILEVSYHSCRVLCLFFSFFTPPSFIYTAVPSYIPFSTDTDHLRYKKGDFQNQVSFVSVGASGIHCCKRTGVMILSELKGSLAAEGEAGLL